MALTKNTLAGPLSLPSEVAVVLAAVEVDCTVVPTGDPGWVSGLEPGPNTHEYKE